MSMRGVSSMWETPPSYQRQVVTWLNQTNPVKLSVLRVLWQFKNYSTIQNHWEPKRAENTVKKIKKTKLWATCDYLPSLFAFCSLFLWGFAGGPPGPDPKGFLQYTSPIYWSWVPACDICLKIDLLITNYSLGALKSHFICVCGDSMNLIWQRTTRFRNA